MVRRIHLVWLTMALVLLPLSSPAPLIYTPGEGWTYEPAGGVSEWKKGRAIDQLAVSTTAFRNQDYSLSLKAAQRVIRAWPLSDYAPHAQYMIGRSFEARGNYARAFEEYEKVLTKYPKSDRASEILHRQYNIATRFLNGAKFRFQIWIPGTFNPAEYFALPFLGYTSMEKTADLFERIVKQGPYSDVAPYAQLRIGAAREKQTEFPLAVTAYELAADRYHDRPVIAADALYRAGKSYEKQARTAEYDQSMAGRAINTYTDFMTYYPDDQRVSEAQQAIQRLTVEQSRGSFEIAKYYEKRSKWNGALIYYNDVLLKNPSSPYAEEARERIERIKNRVQLASN